jgi:septation ring formation regulator EzrA
LLNKALEGDPMEIKQKDFLKVKELVWEIEYLMSNKNFEQAEHLLKSLRNILALLEYDYRLLKGEK